MSTILARGQGINIADPARGQGINIADPARGQGINVEDPARSHMIIVTDPARGHVINDADCALLLIGSRSDSTHMKLIFKDLTSWIVKYTACFFINVKTL